ncbi:MAG TPA: hypothetical protein VNK82_03735 [Terriglobales bacterium]|nr:hypothetical protein [Terriglobales bacterium]
MSNRSTYLIATLAVLCLLAYAAALPMPQGKGQAKGQSQKPGQQEKGKPEEGKGKEGTESKEEEPLFKGKLGLKSSSQTKDQATLGFNGIDPNGQVNKEMMAAAPSGEDVRKAKQLSTYSVDTGELDYFREEGQLKPPPGKQGRNRPRGEEVIASRQDAATQEEKRP